MVVLTMAPFYGGKKTATTLDKLHSQSFLNGVYPRHRAARQGRIAVPQAAGKHER